MDSFEAWLDFRTNETPRETIDRCIECRKPLTSENDGGGIEVIGEGYICVHCHEKEL